MKKETSSFKPFLDQRFMKVRIKGTTPLIVHAWSQKALLEMLSKQRKHAKGGRPLRDPEAEYQAAKYKDINGNDAFLSCAIKNAMITSVSAVEGVTKVLARQSFFTYGVVDKERITLEYDKENDGLMREDTVRLGGASNPADLRFRPEYVEWQAEIFVEYNALSLSKQQVLNLMALAGYSVGLHEWRPERNGDFGRFEVVSHEDVDERITWNTSTLYLRKKDTSVWDAIQAIETHVGVSGKETLKASKKESG